MLAVLNTSLLILHLPKSNYRARARQVSLYVRSNKADARICYLTPRKCLTYRVDNIGAHRQALHQIALRCDAFLALSDDPEFFLEITVPDLESYFWRGPARQLAFEIWHI
jgi:hypothetical protein